MADLFDIDGYEYPAPIGCSQITHWKVKRAVRKSAPNKPQVPDSIPNGILQETLDILLPHLYKLFNACLRLGYCLTYFRESITVVLGSRKGWLEPIRYSGGAQIALQTP